MVSKVTFTDLDLATCSIHESWSVPSNYNN